MRTFIQLRDNIAFAYVITDGEVDHTVTPDHTTAVEVTTSNPESYIKKAYNAETQTWSPAPVIRFALLNELGEIAEIRHTVFSHEVPEYAVIMPEGANGLWKYTNGSWVEPTVLEPAPIVYPPVVNPEFTSVDASSEN